MVFITLVGAGIPLTISKITATNKVSNNYNNTYSSVTTALTLEILFSIILILLIFVKASKYSIYTKLVIKLLRKKRRYGVAPMELYIKRDSIDG